MPGQFVLILTGQFGFFYCFQSRNLRNEQFHLKLFTRKQQKQRTISFNPLIVQKNYMFFGLIRKQIERVQKLHERTRVQFRTFSICFRIRTENHLIWYNYICRDYFRSIQKNKTQRLFNSSKSSQYGLVLNLKQQQQSLPM